AAKLAPGIAQSPASHWASPVDSPCWKRYVLASPQEQPPSCPTAQVSAGAPTPKDSFPKSSAKAYYQADAALPTPSHPYSLFQFAPYPRHHCAVGCVLCLHGSVIDLYYLGESPARCYHGLASLLSGVAHCWCLDLHFLWTHRPILQPAHPAARTEH